MLMGGILTFLLHICVGQHLQFFYTKETETSRVTLDGGCIRRDWDGIDPEGVQGQPWVSRLECEEGQEAKLDGVVRGGSIQLWLEAGSLTSENGRRLEVVGSSAWYNRGAILQLSLGENSRVWAVGAPLQALEGGKVPEHVYWFPGPGNTPPRHRFYDTLDFLDGAATNAGDRNINNGSANARNIIWKTTTRVDPSSILIVDCEPETSWVDFHIHPYGAVYMPLAGDICFKTNKVDCITTGEARWTSPNLFYMEHFYPPVKVNEDWLAVAVELGMYCYSPMVFAVTNLDITSPMGDSIFDDPHSPCVMPNGPDNRWGYCETVTTWSTRYTPHTVTVTRPED